jgi:DNA-binding NarL/FixJ family response regulator
MNLLIADDTAILCESLSRNLENLGHVILKRCHNGQQLIDAHFNYKSAEAIITNIRMPKVSGIEAITEIRKKDKQILIIALTQFEQKLLVQETFKAGAQALLLKSNIDALYWIQFILENKQAVMTKDVSALLLSDDPAYQGLTPQKEKIVSLTNQGLSNKEICSELNITKNTLKTHLQGIRDNGFKRVSQLVQQNF